MVYGGVGGRDVGRVPGAGKLVVVVVGLVVIVVLIVVIGWVL